MAKGILPIFLIDSATTGRKLRSPLTVALLVLLLWGSWCVLFFARGRDIRDLATIGLVPLTQSHSSSVIRVDPHYHYYPGGVGYDGQYSYFLALDPVHAADYMDYPGYRYTRILYPLMARLLAAGQAPLVPYSLLLVNLLALVGGTWLIASWLARNDISPWLALLFGCYPGLVVALQHDLNEPLAYALTALGLTLLDSESRRRWLYAGLAFAAAALTRETTALIPFTIGVYALLRPEMRRGALQVLVLTFSPFLLYKLFLLWWLGSLGTPAAMLPTPIPFGGLLHWWPPQGPQIIAIVCVVLPALVVALAALRDMPQNALAATLVLQILLLVVLLPPLSYMEIFSPTRITAGIPLITLFYLPQLDVRYNGKRTWLLLAGGLWLALLPWLLLTNFSYW